ncbi:YrhC family protein [Pontibacillus salicampi]|uniref:YrhC family protein n=1 Tax=Pontibacillus salicampi TaxID=1449801 RepID=A0ABV6LJF1_9BACI
MEQLTKQLQGKVEDYKRFILTLIILSVYFYMGTIITTFIHPSGYNLLLLGITIASIVAAGVFVQRWQKLNKQLHEMEA